MIADVGDEIVVDGTHIGDPKREGEVLEVLRVGDVIHYRVQWDDGHETVFFAGPDAHVVRLHARRAELSRSRSR